MANCQGVVAQRDWCRPDGVTAERWREIEAVFERALGLPAEKRPAFFEQTCNGDEELRREVESLLDSHASAGNFIDKRSLFFSGDILDEIGVAMAAGKLIGQYRILREIGRGGMGAVYLAERADRQYEKRVAIKLIKRGMDSESVLRHFRNERQILANFDHPNIARLFDGGTTTDGLPYFVMEYVEGVPIDKYCEARRLSVTERLKLFREVCAAVSYAHRHTVIHRDIKPSNVLVTVDGVPKLLDFGIAKILQTGDEAPLVTAAGARPMTPEYASPEQVRGEPVTTASDVYSLGVVLYELLTGSSPYRLTSHAVRDVERAITEQEPTRPSAVNPNQNRQSQIANRKFLKGDLDNMLLMALRKEPERRYQSAEQLSEDIQRHLEERPVRARKDTVTYRALKFVRRNKSAAAAAALILASLIAGLIATTWQAHRAKVEKARAERRFNDVRQLAHSVLFDYHDAIKDLPGATRVRERLVKDALTYLDSLSKESGNDVSLKRELAAAYDKVGDARGEPYGANLGDRIGAIESYLKALNIRESLVASVPRDVQGRRDLAASYKKVGNQLLDTSEAVRGLEHLRNSLALYSELAAEQPANQDLRNDLAEIYNDVGLALEDRGDMAGALKYQREALPLREEFVAADPRDAKARRNLSVTYVNTGRALFFTGDIGGALQINRKALELRTALVAQDPTNADYRRLLAIAYQNDGDYRAQSGDTAGALQSFRKKIALDQEALMADPANAQARGDFAYSSERIGVLLSELGEYAQALISYRRALEVREALARDDSQSLSKRYGMILSRGELGLTEAKLSNQRIALAECGKIVALLNETIDDPANAYIRALRARAYNFLGETYAALASLPKTAPGEAKAHWLTARGMYQQSLAIWQDLHARGTLAADDVPKLEETVREIAKCEAALSR
jgi:serine/threonine protein kinase